jgi:hypothetical protein
MFKYFINAMFFLVTIIIFSRCKGGKIICKATDYKIYSNSGKIIPADLYIESRRKNKVNSYDILSYLVVFGDSIGFRSQGEPDVLIIYPNEKILAEPNLYRGSFTRVDDNCLWQPSKNVESRDIVNNKALYSDPPIKFSGFDGRKIVFNTYGPLRQYGDSITIEW